MNLYKIYDILELKIWLCWLP